MIEAPVKEPRDLSGPTGVQVEVVSRTFVTKRGEVKALDGMSLRAPHGAVVAVVGPSGCGKTTLLELICGLQSPDAGTVTAAPAVLMPQRDLLLPVATRDRQRVLSPCARGAWAASRPGKRRHRGSSGSASGASSRPGPPSSPGGCARGSRSCGHCWRASRCWRWTSRLPHWTRSPGRRCRRGSRTCSRSSRARSCSSRTTSRKRSCSATGWS